MKLCMFLPVCVCVCLKKKKQCLILRQCLQVNKYACDCGLASVLRVYVRLCELVVSLSILARLFVCVPLSDQVCDPFYIKCVYLCLRAFALGVMAAQTPTVHPSVSSSPKARSEWTVPQEVCVCPNFACVYKFVSALHAWAPAPVPKAVAVSGITR